MAETELLNPRGLERALTRLNTLRRRGDSSFEDEGYLRILGTAHQGTRLVAVAHLNELR